MAKELTLEDIPKNCRVPNTGCKNCKGLGWIGGVVALSMCRCNPFLPARRPTDLREWAEARGEWMAKRRQR